MARRFRILSIALLLGLGLPLCLTVDAGRAADAALGNWLPKADTAFQAWSDGLAAHAGRYDYFVCGTAAAPSLPKQDFHYAGSACPLLKSATPFVYGSAEPIKGSILYDRTHAIVLFNTGCCAWRGYVLARAGPPPQRVADRDLSGVRTARGIELEMTPARVTQIYGRAALHAVKTHPGIEALYYTTMHGTPKYSPDACGQYQSFFFKNDRLVEIDLLSGC